MRFFIHTLFMTSFVWMVLHFWRQLPLLETETPRGRLQEFIEWTGKGVVVPLGIWMFMNLGLGHWLPPFLPQVDLAKNSGGFWPWTVLKYSSPAMSVIVSFWAALSLLVMALRIRARTEDRPQFHGTALMWTGFMLPICGVVLLISGPVGIGFAIVVWLAPIVHGTLPEMVKVRRAPSYSQAIAKLKFGKFSEAEWEIIRELEQCENDFNGWMMLAELYAIHFRDFEQGKQTILDLCEQPDIQPSDACVALHRLADWYLQLCDDPRGARRCMEAIHKRYPNTHLDRMAQLRLNRIPVTAAEWIEENQGKPLHLPALRDDLEEESALEPVDPGRARERAERLSQKLARDPNDVAGREEFARALAQLDKLQPAIDQLDLLLGMEGQDASRRAEWTGLKVAWLMRLSPGSEKVEHLLRRLTRDFPNSPQAMAAQRRLMLREQQARVARVAEKKKKPRIVIRLDKEQKSPGDRGLN